MVRHDSNEKTRQRSVGGKRDTVLVPLYAVSSLLAVHASGQVS